MSKKIYDLAFENLQVERRMSNHFEEMGLSFEYGSGFWGKQLETLCANNNQIILNALGLHAKTHTRTLYISGEEFVCDYEVLYRDDNDSEFTITYDEFFDFIDAAIRNTQLRELFWDAIVEKNIEAKNRINKLFAFKIGRAFDDN